MTPIEKSTLDVAYEMYKEALTLLQEPDDGSEDLTQNEVEVVRLMQSVGSTLASLLERRDDWEKFKQTLT